MLAIPLYVVSCMSTIGCDTLVLTSPLYCLACFRASHGAQIHATVNLRMSAPASLKVGFALLSSLWIWTYGVCLPSTTRVLLSLGSSPRRPDHSLCRQHAKASTFRPPLHSLLRQWHHPSPHLHREPFPSRIPPTLDVLFERLPTSPHLARPAAVLLIQ